LLPRYARNIKQRLVGSESGKYAQWGDMSIRGLLFHTTDTAINVQRKQDKMTSNDLQNITQKTKIEHQELRKDEKFLLHM
jgi:hypothetical protein